MRSASLVVSSFLSTLALVASCTSEPSGDDTSESTDSMTDTSSGTTSTNTETETLTDTETETETETDTDTDTGTDTDTDPPGPDMGMSGDCDSFEQDCPVGEKCVPFLDGDATGYKCVEVTGGQPPGEDCVYGGPMEATDDCDENGACWGISEVDDELVGTCLPFCAGPADMPSCAEGSHCILGSGDIHLCAMGCSPLQQDCAMDEGCYWSGQFSCQGTTDNFALGETCGFTNDCAPGLTCANAQFVPGCAGEDCCIAFCDVGLGDDQCAGLPGTTCNAFLPPAQAPTGYEHIGVCVEV